MLLMALSLGAVEWSVSRAQRIQPRYFRRRIVKAVRAASVARFDKKAGYGAPGCLSNASIPPIPRPTGVHTHQ